MSKHTPAPWVGDNHGYVWAENGQMTICTIRGWGHLTGVGAMNLFVTDAIEIQDANQRLICAAPELLEALQCQADYEMYMRVNLGSQIEICAKWLPRIEELFPKNESPRQACSAWARHEFAMLPELLRRKALAKALGEDVG